VFAVEQRATHRGDRAELEEGVNRSNLIERRGADRAEFEVRAEIGPRRG
jgi:hypothetical protein